MANILSLSIYDFIGRSMIVNFIPETITQNLPFSALHLKQAFVFLHLSMTFFRSAFFCRYVRFGRRRFSWNCLLLSAGSSKALHTCNQRQYSLLVPVSLLFREVGGNPVKCCLWIWRVTLVAGLWTLYLTDTLQNVDGRPEESNMEDGQFEVNVPIVAGALG